MHSTSVAIKDQGFAAAVGRPQPHRPVCASAHDPFRVWAERRGTHFVLVATEDQMITANQPFGEWGKVFPDQAMTVAVVDRLVHHATIFEMNVESYRRRAALERKRGRGRPPTHATVTANA